MHTRITTWLDQNEAAIAAYVVAATLLGMVLAFGALGLRMAGYL